MAYRIKRLRVGRPKPWSVCVTSTKHGARSACKTQTQSNEAGVRTCCICNSTARLFLCKRKKRYRASSRFQEQAILRQPVKRFKTSKTAGNLLKSRTFHVEIVAFFFSQIQQTDKAVFLSAELQSKMFFFEQGFLARVFFWLSILRSASSLSGKPINSKLSSETAERTFNKSKTSVCKLELQRMFEHSNIIRLRFSRTNFFHERTFVDARWSIFGSKSAELRRSRASAGPRCSCGACPGSRRNGNMTFQLEQRMKDYPSKVSNTFLVAGI